MNFNQLLVVYNQLLGEIEILKEENLQLKKKLSGSSLCTETQEYEVKIISDSKGITVPENENYSGEKISKWSDSKMKVDLFMSLFRGREDVCAKQWSNGKGYSPYCENEWKSGYCPKTINAKSKCTSCDRQKFVCLNEAMIEKHLRGEIFLGVYPMTVNDGCYFVAMDFDEANWKSDLNAVREVCLLNDISAYAEISKSGNGAHIWFLFEDEIKASLARKFASQILTDTMNSFKNLGFDSYDRLFPSQDYLQKDGFGNLIALPLNGKARKQHHTEFVDIDYNPFDDQWSYLAQIKKTSLEKIEAFVNIKKDLQEMLGYENLDTLPDVTQTSKYHELQKALSKSDFPEEVLLHKSSGILIDKNSLSARAINTMRRMASFGNPEFYSKQTMRMSTYKTPRIIEVYRETNQSIWLPRGVEDKLLSLLNEYKVKTIIDDKTTKGKNLDTIFKGELRDDQKKALNELLKYKNGVLSATTGFGKTVIGAAIIAEKKVNTLVLVHTRQLADQWIERLTQFLEITESFEEDNVKKRGRKKKHRTIGLLGGGENDIIGTIDVAIMQSLFTDKEVKPLVKDYGLVLVDECHHISATSFNQILSEVNACFVYGLSATPIRKDGHHPNIFMQCGPIRYKVDAKLEAAKRTFEHYVIPRFTSFIRPIYQDEKEWQISTVYKMLSEDELRNQRIVEDIVNCIGEGRNPIVLTQRKEHAAILTEMLRNKGIKIITLTGSLSAKGRKLAYYELDNLKDTDKNAIVATGKLVGEGFDLPRLDTLFLVMPIAWKGTVAQYVGRLHREYEGKKEVQVYDYVDVHVGVLERMYHKRLKGYTAVGYGFKLNSHENSVVNSFFTSKEYFKQLKDDIYKAEKSIIISVPVIYKKRLLDWLVLLDEMYKNGVHIVIITRPIVDHNENEISIAKEIISMLNNRGFDVRFVNEQCPKIIAIDDELIWYGDLNIFGYYNNEDSIMRLKNKEIANELLKVE